MIPAVDLHYIIFQNLDLKTSLLVGAKNMKQISIIPLLILWFNFNVSTENPALTSTVKIKKDVVVVAWLDGDGIDLKTLEPNVSPGLKEKLNRKNLYDCLDTVNLLAAGNGNEIKNDIDRLYVNSFLLKHSANKKPPDKIRVDEFRDLGDYKLFSHLTISFPVRDGSIAGTVDYIHHETILGETRDACGTPPWAKTVGKVLVNVREGKDVVSPERNTWDGARGNVKNKFVYQLNQGRIGVFGQRVNKTVNWCMGENPCTVGDASRYTPWIWSVIKILTNGDLELDCQIFPRYFVYQNGIRKAFPNIKDGNLQRFLLLDDRSERRLGDVLE